MTSSRNKRGSGLTLEGLSKRYGNVVALDGLSFEVAEGQMFGFVGANGAGKTTAMRIILGVLEPDEGALFWRGKPLDAAARRRFGYMPEERGLYPKMRVGELLSYLARLHGFGKGDAKAAASKWMARLGVSERADDEVEKLSLGNQQRVQLAAALVHEPEALVLDEPFAGLDPVGVDALSEVLLEQTEAGVPVVFSSHQLELVERLCEAVVIIKEGSLVAEGPVEELRSGGEKRLLRVRVEGNLAGWTSELEDLDYAQVVDEAVDIRGREAEAGRDGAFLISLEEGADEQKVLDAARRAGKVTHFAFERPSLTEIFREVVEQ